MHDISTSASSGPQTPGVSEVIVDNDQQEVSVRQDRWSSSPYSKCPKESSSRRAIHGSDDDASSEALAATYAVGHAQRFKEPRVPVGKDVGIGNENVNLTALPSNTMRAKKVEALIHRHHKLEKASSSCTVRRSQIARTLEKLTGISGRSTPCKSGPARADHQAPLREKATLPTRLAACGVCPVTAHGHNADAAPQLPSEALRHPAKHGS